MSNKIATVMFDIDGVIFNRALAEKEAVSSVLATRYNISNSRYMDYWIHCNKTVWRECSNNKITAEFAKLFRWQLLLKELGLTISLDNARSLSQHYYQFACNKKYLVCGIKSVLKECQRHGMPMCVITNGFDEIQRGKLIQCGVDCFFTELISEKQTGFRKPDTRIFQYALNRMNVKASESVYIGDSYTDDILPSVQIGMNAIWFDCNRKLSIENNRYLPDNVYPIDIATDILPLIFPDKNS